MRYAILIQPDDNGTFLVTCPDLPEVATHGETEAECVAHACDAIETALRARIAAGEDIPVCDFVPADPPRNIWEAPTTLWRQAPVPALAVLKVELYRAMRAQDIGKAELARRLGVHLPQVDRLLDLDHASRLDGLAAALAAVDRVVDISVRDAAA